MLRAPVSTGLSPEAAALRSSIFTASDPVESLFDAYAALRRRPDLAREVLLTEGYLYASSPALAAALSSVVRLEDIFREPVVWIDRAGVISRVILRRDVSGLSYVYADGVDAGSRVKLLLMDRVALRREDLGHPIHRDVRAVARQLGFSEMRIRHLSETEVVADLLYGAVSVPTVLRAEGSRLVFQCDSVPRGRDDAVARARDDVLRRDVVLDRLRAVMRDEVAEALPFDEPRTEIGQQDGKLRQSWVWAYRYGRSGFDFNDDRYEVFDQLGRPRVPQVCIDFVTDTFERASGTWYRRRGEPRERVEGRLDFESLGIDNERSVERFIDFAKTHPQSFDVEEIPDNERVPYARRVAFFADLFAHRHRYRPGDIIAIYGERADGKMHYHSFFVYESDVVTGAPSLVAANAGRPRIRPFEAEMTSAPLRSIRARIRPKLGWLEAVAGAQGPAHVDPRPVPASM